MDEFDSIGALFRPLTFGAPEALDLRDDAAVIPARPGFDLVVTKDALVEGVHFLSDDPPGLVARKLLRVNLSDLAAKAADPYGYFLAVAWPPRWEHEKRVAFAQGLESDQRLFGLRLFGGDTVSTPGPLTLSATLLGWTPAGRLVRRDGARAGDGLYVSGTIGDGTLGLEAAQGRWDGSPEDLAYLLERYRLPTPRLPLQPVLRAYGRAAADVSDGLLADAAHLAEASGLGLLIELERLPLSPSARRWLASAPEEEALLRLAAGGDDYEIVCAIAPDEEAAALRAAEAAGAPLAPVGRFVAGAGISVSFRGRPCEARRLGWSHP